MKTLGFLCLLAVYLPAVGQAVNTINFNYIYDPLTEVTVQQQPVNQGDSIILFYRLKSNQNTTARYILKWEKRDSYAQRQGTVLRASDTLEVSGNWISNKKTFPKPAKPWVLTLKVTNLTSAKSWYFFRQIEAHHPVNGFLEKAGEIQWTTYASVEGRYIVRGSGSRKPVHFSYYRENFPTPSPPFVVKEPKMDRFLFPDSTFSIKPGEEIGPFAKEGLYLAQEDTLSAQGFSFLVKKDPYPKYNKLADLKGPLLFVTTREENDALGLAVRFGLIVRVVQARGGGHDDRHDVLERDHLLALADLVQELATVLAVDVLHREVDRAALVADIVDLDDILVMKGRRDTRLF